MLSRKERIKVAAREAGFDLVGIASAKPASRDLSRFEHWTASGCAGGMEYMKRDACLRLDPGRFLAGARSVVAVAGAYPVSAQGPGPVAAYARVRDYHLVFAEALNAVEKIIQEVDASARSRIAVDSSPLLERALARRAGLGWIGYSTNLITPRFGPFVLLGFIVTTLALEPDPPAEEGGCESCGLCLEACPTGALIAPYRLDARRCIAYLTIEKKGAFDPLEAGAVGGWAFGCDLCTLACAQGTGWKGSPPARGRLFSETGSESLFLEDLLDRCEEGFKGHFRETPLLRTGKNRLIRNILTAACNRGEPWVLGRAKRYLTEGISALREAALRAVRSG